MGKLTEEMGKIAGASPKSVKQMQNEMKRMVPFTPQLIEANKGPDLEFDGRLLVEYKARSKSAKRWTEYELWETRGGAWIVNVVACSDGEGDKDWCHPIVLDQADTQERIFAAMDYMEWNHGARALAKKAGWDLVRRVG